MLYLPNTNPSTKRSSQPLNHVVALLNLHTALHTGATAVRLKAEDVLLHPETLLHEEVKETVRLVPPADVAVVQTSPQADDHKKGDEEEDGYDIGRQGNVHYEGEDMFAEELGRGGW